MSARIRNVGDMYEDRRGLATNRAMHVAVAYEQVGRGATVVDVSAGRTSELNDVLAEMGIARFGVASVDLISRLDNEVRLIEVKGRGSKGPIDLLERQLETFKAAGSAAWLYVVWYATQPGAYRMFAVQDPQRLPWQQTKEASRPSGTPRGTQHEAKFACGSTDVERLGCEVDLTGLPLPSKVDPRELPEQQPG